MKYKVGFPSPLPDNDSEFDEVDFSLLSELIIKKETLKAINDNNLDYEILFSLIAETNENNEEKLFLVGKLEKLNGLSIKKEIDIQTFVDQIAQNFYDGKIPDYCECIKEVKNYIVKDYSNELLNSNILVENGQYNCFGVIFSNEEKTGTLDNIKITGNNTIEMEDFQAIIDLKNGIDLKAVICINNLIYEFNIDAVNENILTINSFRNTNSDKLNEFKDINEKESYSNYEEYLQSRRDLIVKNTYENNIDVYIDILD